MCQLLAALRMRFKEMTTLRNNRVTFLRFSAVINHCLKPATVSSRLLAIQTGPWTDGMGINTGNLLEMQGLRPHPDLHVQNLHFYKIPTWYTYTWNLRSAAITHPEVFSPDQSVVPDWGHIRCQTLGCTPPPLCIHRLPQTVLCLQLVGRTISWAPWKVPPTFQVSCVSLFSPCLPSPPSHSLCHISLQVGDNLCATLAISFTPPPLHTKWCPVSLTWDFWMDLSCPLHLTVLPSHAPNSSTPLQAPAHTLGVACLQRPAPHCC